MDVFRKIRHTCRAKTNKGKRCTRKTNLIYCKQHWRNRKKLKYLLWGIVGFLATIAGFYQDLIFPIIRVTSNYIDPPSYWECKQDQNIRGIIFDDIYTKKNNEIYLLLGLKGKQSWRIQSASGSSWREEPSCILPAGKMGYECAVKYRITDQRKLLVSADLFDVNHCLVGKIFDNKFILNQDCTFTWNFDENGFEVVDHDFNVVFSLHYYPPEAIAIQGVFFSGGELLCINDNGIKHLKNENQIVINEARKTMKPMFEYLGRNWFGKRNPKSSIVDQNKAVRRKNVKPRIPIPKVSVE